MALSPDGEWLAVTGSGWEVDQSGQWQPTALLGLHVVDAVTLQPLIQLNPGSSLRLYGFSADGRNLWFGTEDPEVQVLSLDRLAVPPKGGFPPRTRGAAQFPRPAY